LDKWAGRVSSVSRVARERIKIREDTARINPKHRTKTIASVDRRVSTDEGRTIEIAISSLNKRGVWLSAVAPARERPKNCKRLSAGAGCQGHSDSRNENLADLHDAFLASPKANKHQSRRKVEDERQKRKGRVFPEPLFTRREARRAPILRPSLLFRVSRPRRRRVCARPSVCSRATRARGRCL